MTTPRRSSVTALAIAVASALLFAAAGPFGRSLIDAGWSPSAAVLVRVGGAAFVLLPWVMRAWRRRPPSRGDARLVGLYGVVAVAGPQVCFFSAVQTLDVGVALLLEYLAPVLLVGWAWARTGQPPRRRTTAGAVLSMVGLLLVLDLTGASGVDPVGTAWGIAAAVCLASFFALSDRVNDNLPPVLLAGGGLLVGTFVVAALGIVGVLPLRFTTEPVVMAGATTSWPVVTALMVLLSTVLAYLSGIAAVARLGARVASFVGLTEVIFAVLIAWVLLGQLPVAVQLVGGIAILTGVAFVHSDRDASPRAETTPVPAA